eukprot:scaffold3914_cov121-Cylindrotheca_fusiformis.AAC.13
MLISRMLTVDVTKRITAEKALDSEWIRSAEPRKKKTKKKPAATKKSSSKTRSKSPKMLPPENKWD